MLLSSAVSCTTTDQSRFGEVRASKSCSSSLMTPPLDFAAKSEKSSVVYCFAHKASGMAAKATHNLSSILLQG